MADWSDFVKVLVEKHLIPTLVSIVVAIILPLVVSPTSTLLAPLSRTQLSVLWFCVCFLFIRVITKCIEATTALIAKRYDKERECEEKEQQFLNSFEVIWSVVDKLSSGDVALLKEFLRTNNKPIIIVGDPWHPSGSLLGSQHVHSRVLPGSETTEYTSDEGHPIGAWAGYSSTCTTEYVLMDGFYQALLYSQKTYGRISHFVDEEQQPANVSEH